MGLLRAAMEFVGDRFLTAAKNAGHDLLMLFRAFLWIRSAWTKRHDIAAQCFAAGIESLGLVLFVAMFTGMITALSTGIELARFGQQEVIGAVVSITMAREMGPFMTGLILTAYVGSSMAAELGTMKVSEEIDALEIMSIDVTRFLVMPRLVAMMIATPLLTALADFVGNVGGAMIGYYQLGVTLSAYYDSAIQILDLKAIYTGLLKALVFGVVIATVGCGKGLRTAGGAVGVGQSTRAAVVICFLLIMTLGYFITAIFYGGSLSGGG